MKSLSFSKVNLALWIKEKRPDGFHEIETIFYENKELYDEIEVGISSFNKLEINVSFKQRDFETLIPLERNSGYIAAKLFFEKVGFNGLCNIFIDKKVPIEAGLGGGSSNAATVLKILNTSFDYQLHRSELLILASKIGSDVPFFIIGDTCKGRGRGEVLDLVENKLDLEIKVIKPSSISISTKMAYEEFDKKRTRHDHAQEMNNLLISMKTRNYDLFFKNIFNDFEDIIFDFYPELKRIKQELLHSGYEAAILCGSGSAVCGLKRKK